MPQIRKFCFWLKAVAAFIFLSDMIGLLPICIVLAFLLRLPAPSMTKEMKLWSRITCVSVELFTKIRIIETLEREKTYGLITFSYFIIFCLNVAVISLFKFFLFLFLFMALAIRNLKKRKDIFGLMNRKY